MKGGLRVNVLVQYIVDTSPVGSLFSIHVPQGLHGDEINRALVGTYKIVCLSPLLMDTIELLRRSSQDG